MLNHDMEVVKYDVIIPVISHLYPIEFKTE